MDLRFTGPEPSATERNAIDALLGPPATGWEGGVRDAATDGRSSRTGLDLSEQRHLLLPALHALQDRVGFVSEGGLGYACRRLHVPPAEGFGVASFYALLATRPTPPAVAHACDDIACRNQGALELIGDLRTRLGPEGHAAGDAAATWKRSPCLGYCELAPAVLVTRAGDSPLRATLAPATPEGVLATLMGGAESEPDLASARRSIPQAGAPELRLLSRAGSVPPLDLPAHEARGGLAGLRRALELGSKATIAEVTASGLVGRGGAAFPTGRKWQAVADAAERPHYLCCNADESEPGTFKDRILMEWDPFAVLEGMAIAGLATGCERGYLYLRGEYPLAEHRLLAAMAILRRAGALGDDVLGSGRSFDVEMRRGAGAYICGEETALFNSIEGFRGEPRNKPPFPTQSGLFRRPTLVNNVETLANVPLVLRVGGAAFAADGAGGSSTGPKLFCVSGRVARPGLYEYPFGVTLRQVLEGAGGIAGSGRLQAVLLGGAAGTFVGEEALDVPLTFEALRGIGASLGSGVVMPFDDGVDLRDVLARIAAFFRDESCGQCVPCRVGTVRQEELLQRLADRRPRGSRKEEIALLSEIGRCMKDASICGLGQTASLAVESGLALMDRPQPASRA